MIKMTHTTQITDPKRETCKKDDKFDEESFLRASPVGIGEALGDVEIDGIELGLSDGARVGLCDDVGERVGWVEGNDVGLSVGDIDTLGRLEGSQLGM